MDIEHYLLKGILPESYMDYINITKDNCVMSKWVHHDSQIIREAQTEFHNNLIGLMSDMTTCEA